MEREQRRLAAIVAADVVGYSRLMGRDESGTLANLKALRREVVDPAIASHGGRIVKTTGDGLLLEFPSVVNAVRCAVEVQTAMAAKTAEVPDDRRIAFRVGVNIGDIIADGDDIFGDGVNIAARLQEIAAPGGVCISARVHEDVRDRLDTPFEDGGPQTLKNISRPVQVWRWSVGRASRDGQTTGSTRRRDKPAIAVLPFANMSPDADKEYFSDGITEDIITNLSKFREFHVISRNSSFAYKGTAPDAAKIGRDLGTDYVVEGSVRSAGTRVRIAGQLTDVASGAHIWAERYDRDLTDVFAVQDEITARIATAVDPAVRGFEMQSAMRKHPADLGAWDRVLRGLWHLNQFRKPANADARREFEAAIARDAGFAPAHAWLALTHVFDAWFNWTATHATSLDSAQRAAAEAVRSDASDPMAHAAAAVANFWSGRIEQARSACERALALNPNSFLANFVCGGSFNYSGRCEEAVPYHLKALDLSPHDPLAWNCLGSLAHTWLNLKRYDEAIACADRAIVQRHGYLFGRVIKVAALAHAGRLGEAKAAGAAILDIAPDFSLARLDHYPFVIEAQKQHLLGGLATAGLPASPAAATPALVLPALDLPALPLPDKPSIAVLPFQNMSGDPEQEYFVDGITEDILTELARFRELFVIARNSSFTYKGKSVDIKQVGHELGVHHVLEGSVRRAANRVRVTAQLIDCENGSHLWAERYDRDLADIFAVQEEITRTIVANIAPAIEESALARIRRASPASLTAHEIAARALSETWAAWLSGDPATREKAMASSQRALALDPGCARAWLAQAQLRWQQEYYSGRPSTAETCGPGLEAARRAIAADRLENRAYMIKGMLSVRLGRWDEALADLRHACELNPNDAMALQVLGWGEVKYGDGSSARRHVEAALRLSPRDPLRYNAYMLLGEACFLTGDYAEGLKWIAESRREQPNFLPAIVHGMKLLVASGQIDRARAEGDLLRAISPQLLDRARTGFSDYRRPEDRERDIRFLRIGYGLPVETTPPPLALPDKPSIAVLPFQNMSGDPEQEYFADGIVEDIITALSRFKSLFVIARNSSFTYKGRAVDIKQVGRELGVRCVLEGSVRRAGNRLRITGQLIDCQTGTHLWADRFEGALEDVFDLQDRVTASIVGMIAPKVEQAEIERAKRKPVISVDAYDHLLRAVARLYQLTGEATDDALRQFDAAIERDPDAATAHALKAFCYSWRFFNGWMADPGTERADAERHARRAVELAGDDADVLAYSGYTLAAVNGDFDDSAALIDRALELNPNLAKGWGASAWLRVFVGEPDRAIDHAMKAIRLSPIDLNIQSIRNAVGQAHFFAGRFGDAASWARLALQAKADFRPALRLAAAAEALSDNLAAARKYREQLQQLDPEACLAASMKVYSSYRPEHAAKLREGLRLAGLPE